MFKNLLQFWKGKDFLSAVLDDFKQMLDDTELMYTSVCKNLIHNEALPDLENQVYTLDTRVNERQRDIRKRVIEHLTIQPLVDAPVCLILMSVVKDAERLGDYGKNLYEVTKLTATPIDQTSYAEHFTGIEQQILDLFRLTQDSFLESDETKAKETWVSERKVVKRCDEIISQLADSGLSVNEGICLTLISRYFKRIAAHLTNIATSVILPVSDLDYFDEKRRQENR